MRWSGLPQCVPEGVRSALASAPDAVREIRIRAGRQTEIVRKEERLFVGEIIDAPLLRKIALSMMEYSYYSRESELANGYFTMKDGCRVGVCGTFVRLDDGKLTLQSVGSLCIRIAREIQGCARELVDAMLQDGEPVNTLIISRPGMGKTTLLRDAARLLSEGGYAVAIADERHEIAACRDGIPTLDVGPRTDVADGGDKYAAMEMLVRSMSPRVIVADEIGGERDIAAVREASRRGVAVLTSAHAAGLEDLRYGPLQTLISEQTFAVVALLEGAPGRIAEIWKFRGR